MSEMNLKEIMHALPHRYPFLLVDKIVECDDEKRIVGLKNVTVNEPFFQGHFPGEPIMPGVLQLEAMAQVGGVMMNRKLGTEGDIAYFLAVNNARFRRMVVPGDQLLIEITFQKMRLGMAKVHGIVSVDGDVAAEADLMFGSSRK